MLKLWYMQYQNIIVLQRLNKHKGSELHVYAQVSGHVGTVKLVVEAESMLMNINEQQ